MAMAMGVIGLGASLAGGILGAEGAKTTAADQQKMYNYQAGVAKINSQIDLQNADYARNQGEIQATQFGLKEAQQEARSAENAALSVKDDANKKYRTALKRAKLFEDANQGKADPAKIGQEDLCPGVRLFRLQFIFINIANRLLPQQ